MADRWEDQRKRARALENSIDVKLVLLNKLNTNGRGSAAAAASSDTKSRKGVFDNLCEEIDSLLAKLSALNDEMTNHVASHEVGGGGWASNPAVQHTLRRHRDILRDYGSEFARARENIRGQLEREFLLSGSHSTSIDGTCLNNRVKASDLYMKEQDHISSCDRLIDEQMSIAIATKENLARQGYSMRDISRKMHTLSKKYPLIGSVMNKIQSRKRRDTLIIAGVISSCLIFTIFCLIH